MDLTDKKWRFDLRTIALEYFDSDLNSGVNMNYYALTSLSAPRAVIKSKRSGKVSLDNKNNLKDRRAWLKINIM